MKLFIWALALFPVKAGAQAFSLGDVISGDLSGCGMYGGGAGDLKVPAIRGGNLPDTVEDIPHTAGGRILRGGRRFPWKYRGWRKRSQWGLSFEDPDMPPLVSGHLDIVYWPVIVDNRIPVRTAYTLCDFDKVSIPVYYKTFKELSKPKRYWLIAILYGHAIHKWPEQALEFGVMAGAKGCLRLREKACKSWLKVSVGLPVK